MDRREAGIQRQHSQEMAIRAFSLLNSEVLTDDEVLSKIKFLTDWFERDIADTVSFRQSNGNLNSGSSPRNRQADHDRALASVLLAPQQEAIKKWIAGANLLDGVADAACMNAMGRNWDDGAAVSEMTLEQAKVFQTKVKESLGGN